MIKNLAAENRKEIEALKKKVDDLEKRIEKIEELHSLQEVATRKLVDEYKKNMFALLGLAKIIKKETEEFVLNEERAPVAIS